MTKLIEPAASAAPERHPSDEESTAGYLHGWFLRALARDPGATALRVGTRAYSYQELHERALALAGTVLARLGERPRRVGLLAARSLQAYAGMLAAGYAGAAVVPLNPDFPAERTGRMIAAAGLDALLVDGSGRAVLPELAGVLGTMPVIGEDQPGDRPAPPLAAPCPADPGSVAYILFTSGSTGRPKGVPVLHSNIESYLRFVHERYAFGPTDVFSQAAELTFDLAMFDIYGAWGCGGTLVSMPPEAFTRVPEFVRTYGITVWCTSPSVISLVRRLRALKPAAMPSLRVAVFCGEPLLRQDAVDWQAAAPNALVENLYGPTELTVSCSVHEWDPATSPDRCVNGIVSIGAMHPGLDHVLVDADGAVLPEPADPDDPGTDNGELCVTGPQMFPGYLDAADDEGRFLDHDGRRWYRTGDIARRIPGGELAYLGRRDHQVKVHGVRVELSEVEYGLRRCRGVLDAVVLVHEGELHAFYLGERRPDAELIEELGAFFPRYLIPLRYQHLAEFPMNSNRKTDRPVLAARLAERGGRGAPRPGGAR